jgi:26S proteasome regulatory subunit N13
MTSPVLFSTGASPTSSSSRNLVEFKAGKMEVRDKMVHPIKRQGLVYLRQSPDDSLMHFCWKDRQTGVVEDDLILFPDDCEFKHVKECTTGRVYVLKMKSSNKKMFFWMQEFKSERDEEYCKKINEMLNNPPRAGSESGASTSERDLQQLFGNMSQDQIANLLSSNGVNLASLLNASGRSPSSNSGTSGSSTASTINSAPTSAQSATGGSNSSSQQAAGRRDYHPMMNDLRAILSGALMEGSEDEVNELMAATGGQDVGLTSGSSSQRETTHQPLIDLSTAINSESLAALLNDEQFLRQVEPHLPQVDESNASLSRQLGDTVRSSQFRSSMSQFCVALQSGQLGPLMSQFGLNQPCVDAANLGNLEAFVRALEAQMRSSRASDPQAQQPPSGPKDKN